MLKNPALKTVHAASQRYITRQVRSYSRRALTTLAFPDLRLETTVQTTTKHGMDVIHDPLLSKGTAFSIAERERLGIRGLVPPRTQEMDKQLQRIMRNLRQSKTPLEKFVFMTALQDRNETLYYRLLIDNLEELSQIIYTPTVGEACLRFHSIYRRARGMYFSTLDRGQMAAMIHNWPHDQVDVIVVTDGSRVLGLGDLGANGMQIPIGKLSLYVAGGGIRPTSILPVVLDVGTNNEALLNDPLYLGMGHRRLEGDEYYSFVDEWVHAIHTRYPHALIQFEDFKYPHAYNLLNKYKEKYCCFNDDIQSTSAVALAGVLASLKARGKSIDTLNEERIICVGAGSAGVGVCEGIIDCMVEQGKVKTREEAYSKIWMLDQYGLLGNSLLQDNDGARSAPIGLGDRSNLDERQLSYLKKDMKDRMSLEEVVKAVKPTVILGLSGSPGVFTEGAIRAMAANVEKPCIFPLSNPTHQSECTAEQAFEWTDGRAIFASGSPFKDVEYKGKIRKVNQINNAMSFPGLGLGITVSRASRVTGKMFLETAVTIASMASEDQLKQGILFPGVGALRQVSKEVATRVCEIAHDEGLARAPMRPGTSLRNEIEESMWVPEYVPTIRIDGHI
ncbi:Malic enzyme [Entomortierella chlamydospora]|uniref:Malic enzyme n=1 Tax=Entomortierella chlamydospora TaxID=101097 RepID=A0A9P6MU95_9FUNG|nr:Malic enzyme [Entomortierella chlamydospora]KAG0012973.1 Malic enzyme [Entomortierella chlamydospora]